MNGIRRLGRRLAEGVVRSPLDRLDQRIARRHASGDRLATVQRWTRYIELPEQVRRSRNVVYVWAALVVLLRTGVVDKQQVNGPGISLTLSSRSWVVQFGWVVPATLLADYWIALGFAVYRLRLDDLAARASTSSARVSSSYEAVAASIRVLPAFVAYRLLVATYVVGPSAAVLVSAFA